MLRQLRPICWNENMPVHAPPLDCSDDCFRYPNCACSFLSKINLSVNRAAVQCLALAVSSRMSASLIGRFGYTFRLSTTVAGMLGVVRHDVPGINVRPRADLATPVDGGSRRVSASRCALAPDPPYGSWLSTLPCQHPSSSSTTRRALSSLPSTTGPSASPAS